jgi:hypothetical protein
MRGNPPWADKALKKNWPSIAEIAREKGLPLPVGESSGKWDELGCGHYGCVLETEDDAVVFKLTSDPTEAAFIQAAAPLGWPAGIVEYFALAELDFTFRRRPVWAIWREAAFDVGQLEPPYGADRRDYEVRSRREFGALLDRFRTHADRFRTALKRTKRPVRVLAEAKELSDWAWRAVGYDEARGDADVWRKFAFLDNQRGAYRLASSWRACEIIAEYMANTYLADSVGGALEYYLTANILLADVHGGNIGKAMGRESYDEGEGPWVITDPGHAVFVEWSAE